VVSTKPAEIVLDTSGRSSASVREHAQPIEKVVQEAADAIQTFIQSKGVNLSISVDHSTGYHIIRVTDNNGNMVMQLPSEEAVRIAHSMNSLQGVFVDQFA
jgi:flagellar protein FlaG